MFFFSRSLSGLIQWCRALKHGHRAGLSLLRIFKLQATKGPMVMRPMADRIAERLEGGEALEDALNAEGDALPRLFRQLAGVGERTGHLPEIFSELTEYYELQQKLGREFRSQITMPVLQFFAAVFVVAGLIFVLGFIAETRGGGPAPEPIGLGLSGKKGAITFLVAVGVFLASLAGVYVFITRGLRRRTTFESWLLHLPVAGPCAEAFAMGRFCLALRMTMETGMHVDEALSLSLRATGNAAFESHEPDIVSAIKSGEEVSVALRQCKLFPEEFLQTVAVAEVSGQIPEVMIRQGEYYREEASRRLKSLAGFAAHAVWAAVAFMIIVAIFRIASIYVGALNQAAG